MKKCELCNKAARMYCHSDQASLCWNCDYRVHTANFIVSKHTRTLLCHSCQGPTPWTGSGSNLGPTVSVCDSCANGNTDPRNPNSDEEDDTDDLDEDDDRTHDEDDDGENQVVPLSLTPSLASTSSSGGTGGSSSGFLRSGLGSSEATASTESLRLSYDGNKAAGKKGFRSWKWR